MNYFTRDRYLALQDPHEGAMDAADADWEAAVAAYDVHLQRLRPEMPESVRQLLDGFYLHDARVLSIGQRGEAFVISLRLDIPPNDLLTIFYNVSGRVVVTQELFPWAKETDPIVDWIYD